MLQDSEILVLVLAGFALDEGQADPKSKLKI